MLAVLRLSRDRYKVGQPGSKVRPVVRVEVGEEGLGVVYLCSALDEAWIHLEARVELTKGGRIMVKRHVAIREVLQIV
jgi:hypothetical protein